jgi:hypothetical protein
LRWYVQAFSSRPQATPRPSLNRHTQQNVGPQPNVCSGTTCNLSFSAVPAGYRLEVSYVSAEFVIETGPPYVLIDNGASGTSHATVSLPTPTILNTVDSYFQNCFLSAPVTFYVEAGNKPKIILASSNQMAIAGVGPFRVTLVGKLVPLDSGAKDVE